MLLTVTALEEAELIERFGDSYRAYMEQVPRRFVPRLDSLRTAASRLAGAKGGRGGGDAGRSEQPQKDTAFAASAAADASSSMFNKERSSRAGAPVVVDRRHDNNGKAPWMTAAGGRGPRVEDEDLRNEKDEAHDDDTQLDLREMMKPSRQHVRGDQDGGPGAEAEDAVPGTAPFITPPSTWRIVTRTSKDKTA